MPSPCCASCVTVSPTNRQSASTLHSSRRSTGTEPCVRPKTPFPMSVSFCVNRLRDCLPCWICLSTSPIENTCHAHCGIARLSASTLESTFHHYKQLCVSL